MDKKGFTLIELLIVIAIVGVLSSVVLSSLNSARGKGANVAVKSGMINMRSQSEIYYDDNYQSYAGVCLSQKFLSILANASSTGGGTSGCADDLNTWAAYSQLKIPETNGSYWCVDNMGASKAIATTGVWGTYSCQTIEWYTVDVSETLTDWYTANTACASLSPLEGKKVGIPWRLPSKDELLAKYNENHSDFRTDWYWSNTVDPNNGDNVYGVSMNYGSVVSIAKNFPPMYARCAR